MTAPGGFSSAPGGTVTLPGGVTVDLPASPFVRELVTIFAHFANGLAEDQVTLAWIDGEGAETALVTHVLNVSQSGRLTFGKHLEINSQINGASSLAYITIPIPLDIAIDSNTVLRLSSVDSTVVYSNVKIRTRMAKP